MPHGPARHRSGSVARFRPMVPCVLSARAPRMGRWTTPRVPAAFLLAGVLIASVTMLGSRPARAQDAATDETRSTAETKRFTEFETAWQASNATALTACMDAKGKVRVLLLEKPFMGRSGGFDRDRAGKSLARYFQFIHTPKLKDVTPASTRKATPSVRIYDYTYRPKKGDQLTTRLEVRLRRVGKLWVLDALTERRKP